jgi:hypothetical protein
LALKDLANPADSAGRRAVAAAWAAQASKDADTEQQAACCRRALFLYRQALLVATTDEAVAIQVDLRALEERVPAAQARWTELDMQDIAEADRRDDVLHLERWRYLSTHLWYQDGINVRVVVRTSKAPIYLMAGRGALVKFSTQGPEIGLRVHLPDKIEDSAHRHLPGSELAARPNVVLKTDEWHTLRWQLTSTRQQVWVDKKVVFDATAPADLSAGRPVVVFTSEDSIEIKSVAVRDLGQGAPPK